ncbi:uncharacterized protein BDZ83DRAFT_731560 [Colletotrichum acutatum]|uniref:Uncharacterized protein n=1 Tax=Glomerella acutata TaxID=27357 RepID=A0AAD8UP48_GLOAC|nr:uncharacterized protein BDZ83DRAFT_731560 [Colletotrichum acutatum]KAK1723865.1 hypothetical protein BDZ83DRAFT_731560 [Colletotrichum acutatum]
MSDRLYGGSPCAVPVAHHLKSSVCGRPLAVPYLPCHHACQPAKQVSPTTRDLYSVKGTRETDMAHKPPIRAGLRGPAYVRHCVSWLSSAGGVQSFTAYYPIRPCGRLPQLQQATASCCTLPVWATDDAGRTEREAGPVRRRGSREKDTDETPVDTSLQTGSGTDFSGGLRREGRDR